MEEPSYSGLGLAQHLRAESWILAAGRRFWRCGQQQKGHSWASWSLKESAGLASGFEELCFARAEQQAGESRAQSVRAPALLLQRCADPATLGSGLGRGQEHLRLPRSLTSRGEQGRGLFSGQKRVLQLGGASWLAGSPRAPPQAHGAGLVLLPPWAPDSNQVCTGMAAP